MSQCDLSECDKFYTVFPTPQKVLIGTSQSEKKAQASQFKHRQKSMVERIGLGRFNSTKKPKNRIGMSQLESQKMTLRRPGPEIMVTNGNENRERSSDIDSIGFQDVSLEDSYQYTYICLKYDIKVVFRQCVGSRFQRS